MDKSQKSIRNGKSFLRLWEQILRTSFGCFYPFRYIGIGAMNAWMTVLNHGEQYRCKDSLIRLFCACNMLVENIFKPKFELLIGFELDFGSTLIILNFKHTKDVDWLFIPIL